MIPPRGRRYRQLGASLLGLILGASLVLRCHPALAEPSATGDERDAARLFSEGRALLVDGRFTEACPKLEESQRLEPRLGTQLNVAFCQERLGKVATAWLGYQEAAITARREGDVARAQFASERTDAVAPRVPWLKVRAPLGSAIGVEADSLTVILDGARLAPTSWGKALPVDPGEHSLVAARHGETYWRTTVALTESARVDIAVPAPAQPPRPEPNVAEPRAYKQPGTRAMPARPSPHWKTTARGFVYEVGVFAGLISVDTNVSKPDGGADKIRARVVDGDTVETSSCAEVFCDYPSLGATAGIVLGVKGFAGYGVTPQVDLGLRFLVGPRAGGGGLIALGPSASFSLGERFRAGPSIVFGSARHSARDFVGVDAPRGPTSVNAPLHGDLGFAMGLGAEAALALSQSATGSLLLQTTPLFLYGSNGNAWTLPVGAAYHWN